MTLTLKKFLTTYRKMVKQIKNNTNTNTNTNTIIITTKKDEEYEEK